MGTWDSALIIRDILIHLLQEDVLMIDKREQLDIELKLGKSNCVEMIEVIMNKNLLNYDCYNWNKWLIAIWLSFQLYPYEHGFDLYTTDGEKFHHLNKNGFKNKFNYGLCAMFIASNNKMYMGIANPYQGCEIWIYWNKSCWCHCKDKCYDKE